jgi:lipid-binding SYLF domain-containing protein
MLKRILVCAALLGAGTGNSAVVDPAVESRLSRSTSAMRLFLAKAPAPALELFQKALCIGIVPRYEAGGEGELGQGFVSCRQKPGSPWSAPAAVQVSGGGLVWDIAGAYMSVLMLVNTPDAVKRMSPSQVIIGPDLRAYPRPLAAIQGPGVPPLPSGVFGYSVSDSDIQPVTLNGAMMTAEESVNAAVYGTKLSSGAILSGSAQTEPPMAVREFLAALSAPGNGAAAAVGSASGMREHAGN